MTKIDSRSYVSKGAIEKLREDIILKKYSPEDRLLEVELAKIYNVSRGSIRVVIQKLIHEGLIEENNNVHSIPKPLSYAAGTFRKITDEARQIKYRTK